MDKNDEDNQKGITPKNKIFSWALIIGLFGAALFIIFLGQYYREFGEYGISSKLENWALFGDYLGGTLGAVFGFLTLLAVLCALYVQTERLDKSIEISESNLKATREELKKANELQEKQSFALRAQTLENSFFKLIEILIENRLNFRVETTSRATEYFRSEAFKFYFNGLRVGSKKI